MSYCTQCGTQLPSDVRFCTSCGKPAGAASAPAPQRVTPPRPQPLAKRPAVPPQNPSESSGSTGLPGLPGQDGSNRYKFAGAVLAVALMLVVVGGFFLALGDDKKSTATPTTAAPTPSSASSYDTSRTETDPATLACDSELPDGSVISAGSQRGDVAAIQWGLNQLQYVGPDGGPLVEDGYYGTALVSAVERFQKNHKLAVTGDVDATTWAVISSQLHRWKGINRC